MRNLFFSLVLFTFAQNVFASKTVRLFTIERSTNANYVCYDANLTDEGLLDSENPLSVYWIMAAQDGHREDLTALERKHAFGAEIKMQTEHNVLFTIKAIATQEFSVSTDAGTANAQTLLDHRTVMMQKAFVQTKGSIFPTVEFIRFYGFDSKTGQPVESVYRPARKKHSRHL